MKRRSFFKFLAAAPAAIAGAFVPSNPAAQPLRTGTGPNNGTGDPHCHAHTLSTCEIPSHTHTLWHPCPGCFYEAVPEDPRYPRGAQTVGLSCLRGLPRGTRHCQA